jgi:hypothetical protein
MNIDPTTSIVTEKREHTCLILSSLSASISKAKITPMCEGVIWEKRRKLQKKATGPIKTYAFHELFFRKRESPGHFICEGESRSFIPLRAGGEAEGPFKPQV